MESDVEFCCDNPFGTEWTNDVLGTEQKLRFTGHERDPMDPTQTTDDLDWMHARHYNLNLARFLSVDPVGGDPLRPQSWNAYAYVLNNPLNLVDPFGMTEGHPTNSTDDCGLGEGCGQAKPLSTWGQWLLNLLLPHTADDGDDDPYGEAAAFEELGIDGSQAVVKKAKKVDAGLKDAGGMIVEEGVTAGMVVGAARLSGQALRLARKLHLNPQSPTSQQVLSNLDKPVAEFVATYRKGKILRRLPREALRKGVTVGDALNISPTVRKLLVDRRWAK